MRVFFVKPGNAGTNYPHSYAVLAAWLRKMGHSAQFYDASLQAEPPEAVLNRMPETDLVALSLLTGWHPWTRRFIRLLRQQRPGLPVVVGGPHVSALGDIAVTDVEADFGIMGEGEIPLGRLVEVLGDETKLRLVPGLIWRQNGVWTHNGVPEERIRELDQLPFPDYELIPPSGYFHTYLGASVARRHYRSVQTVTSRGCPFKCTFCATNATWQRRITFHSPEYVVAEIEHLVKQHGIQEVWFGDDGLTANRSRAIEICERLTKARLGVEWRIPNGIRLETVDDKLAAAMKQAGCYMTGVGIETGSPTMMKRIKKNLNLDMVRERVGILKSHGILTSGFFIVGFPGETVEEMDETVRFILNSNLDRMQISIFGPYPGSEDFSNVFCQNDPAAFRRNVENYLRNGKLPEELARVDLSAIQRCFRTTCLKFYTKPAVILSVLRDMRLRQIRDILLHPSFRGLFRRQRNVQATYVDLNMNG